MISALQFAFLASLVFNMVHCTEQTAVEKLQNSINRLKKNVSKKDSCTKICFALYGSSAVNGQIFKLQKQVASSMTKVLSVKSASRVAAVQYVSIAEAIYPYSPVSQAFFQVLKEAEPQRGFDISISSAVVACDYQLAMNEASGTIILFTDGKHNYGSNPQDTIKIARSRGVKVLPVGVGDLDRKSVQKVFGVSSSSILLLDAFWKVRIVLESIVPKICQ